MPDRLVMIAATEACQQRQVARGFGVSQATISLAIRSDGRYKQVSPDERAVEAKRRRDQLAGLRRKGVL